jgi:hypothetical protein
MRDPMVAVAADGSGPRPLRKGAFLLVGAWFLAALLAVCSAAWTAHASPDAAPRRMIQEP